MKKKFKAKEQFRIGEILSKNQTKYPLLYYQDSLYLQRLSLLNSSQFQTVIRTITRDLSLLLEINNEEFFLELANNQSLRTCLESCLEMFPRKNYGRYYDIRDVKRETIPQNDKCLIQYSHLVKCVIFIYYRISQAPQKHHKEIVYNQWLLDIPKLLNIAAIYGQSNPEIVRKIITNAYNITSNYEQDTYDFFNLIQHSKLQQIQNNKQQDINFSAQSMRNKNYSNRQKFMIQATIRIIFTIKDTLFNLLLFIKYFPIRFVNEFVTDYKIQQRLVDSFTEFKHRSEKQWKLGNYKQIYFKYHFEDLRQLMVQYFIEEFNHLRKIVLNGTSDTEEYVQLAHNVYETYCMMLKSEKKKYYHSEFKALINNLIEESQQPVFFLEGSKIIKVTQKTKKIVQQCQQYEKDYRRQHRVGVSLLDFDKILIINRGNIKKFIEVESNCETEYQKQANIKRQKQRLKRQTLSQKQYQFVNQLKYGKTQKQYDDQPQQVQFVHVRLQNQYQRLEKPELNLSFRIDGSGQQRKKYVLKQSVKESDFPNLSFNFGKSQCGPQNLSFAIKDDQPKLFEGDISQIQEISIISQNNDNILSQLILDDYDFKMTSQSKNKQKTWRNDNTIIDNDQAQQNKFQWQNDDDIDLSMF